jgi:hypothetical protein
MIHLALSGLNDIALGKSTAQIASYMQGADALAEKNSLIKSIFPVEKSKTWGKKFASRTSLSSGFKPGPENSTAPEGRTQDGYHKTVEDVEWRDSFSVSRKMRDDNMLSDAFTDAKELIQAHYDTQERFGGKFLASAIGTSFDFEGWHFDITGADTKALFATDHPSKTGGTSDQCNLWNLELSDQNINRASFYLSDQRDDNGKKLNIVPDTIIVPFYTVNDADQRKELIQILRADGDPNSADRRGQFNAGLYNVITWNFLEPPTGMTAGKSWFIMADMKYVMAHKPYVLLDRLGLEVTDYMIDSTKAQVFDGYARHNIDTTNDWRGIVACIPGLGS